MINYWTDSIFILFFISGISYVLITFLIQVGLNKKNNKIHHHPTVSLLIAARNEEHNLVDCLRAIENLNYPVDKLEVLLINDQSTDQTELIMKSFCDRYDHFFLLNITNNVNDLRDKMNALAQGINQTRGEIILITDADCQVPQNWVSNFVKYFDKNVGMCGGLTLLSQTNHKERLFCRLQALDWIYLQAVAAGSCQLGLPVSILGNNFAFRRQAYLDVGGFEGMGFSITEDMALMQAIHKHGKWKIVYPQSEKSKIYSRPVSNIREFYNQRKRWVLGGRRTHWWGYLISTISILTHLFLLLLLVTGQLGLFVLLIFIILLSDITLIFRITKRINRFDLLRLLFHFKLFYTIYTIIFSWVAILGKKVKWKDTIHKI